MRQGHDRRGPVPGEAGALTDNECVNLSVRQPETPPIRQQTLHNLDTCQFAGRHIVMRHLLLNDQACDCQQPS